MTEAQLHMAVADYLRLKYPRALWRTDMAGLYIPSPVTRLRYQKLQAGRAWPDLHVAEPRLGFHGLFLELKRENTRIRLADGSLVKDPHIREQAAIIEALTERGFLALFACGWEHAKRIIDLYLTGDAQAIERLFQERNKPLPSRDRGLSGLVTSSRTAA